MTWALFYVGAIAAAVVLALLIRTVTGRSFRIWPTPGPGTWQNDLFWPLFRAVNGLAFAVALLDTGGFWQLGWWLRWPAAVVLGTLCALYASAFFTLGSVNSYCGRQGLVVDGVYRWTRNPQYAALIPLYACLAIAADSLPATVLCAAVIGIYVLMALAEEPWLEMTYGEDYRRYCRRVPRFFNWRRAMVHVQVAGRVIGHQLAARLAAQGQGVPVHHNWGRRRL